MKKLTLIFILFISIPAFAQEEIPANTLTLLGNQEYVYAPSVNFDGNYLIFSTKNGNTYKFYECKKENNNWGSPKELEDISKYFGGNRYFNCPVYNFDASKIYFEAMNGTSTDIYTSSRTTTGWTEPQLLSNKINTNLNEGEPSVSPNDNILYFTRFEDEKNKDCGKIFVSKKDKQFEWDLAKAVITPINTGCERSPRVLSDNKTLIYASKRDGAKNFIFYYTKNLFGNIWLTPQAIGVFSKNDNIFAAIDSDAKKIIFSSSNKDKKSELMIADFPKEYKPEEIFSISGKITDHNNKPISGTISLLDPVSIETYGIYNNNPNTGEYKIFVPKKSNYLIDFSAENHSHYFVNFNNSNLKTSELEINAELYKKVNFYLNVYDKDIYEPFEVEIETFAKKENKKIDTKTEVLDKGKYKLSLPVGQKYNLKLTSDFSEEYNFEIDLTGAVIFDTFEKNIEIISHKAQYTFQVTDAIEETGINCEIILKNKSTSKEIITKAKTDENGKVVIFVRKGDVYDIIINPHGYAFYNTTLEITDNKDKTKNIKLQPLKQDIKIELNNITFETNSAEINVESYKELNSVVKLLVENPEIKVEISAHTDDVGSDTYNQKLSEKRAKSVVEYLIEKDVDKTKLIFQGYGETQPLVPNDSEENRAKNRRVELKIMEVIE